MRSCALLVALAACTDPVVTFAPVIDQPTNASANALPVDQLIVELAHDGDTLDLASAKFTKGQTVEISGAPFADDLVVHLTGFVGTSEVAYGRSCAVAVSASGPVPSPHLYFSRSVKFGQLAVTPEKVRIGGAAITYHDGSGLLVGGVDENGTAVAGVEQFDPRAGTLASILQLMPRTGAVLAPLGTGDGAQIAVIGGLDPTTQTGAQFVELIEADQPGARVQTVPDANMARMGLTATPLTDGTIVAIGGQSSATSAPTGEVDVVSAENGTAVVRMLRAALAVPRSGHTATRLSDDEGAAVLVAGGLDGTGAPIAAAELFKPLSEEFSGTFNASLHVPRTQHQAVRMPDGSVLIIGGVDGSGKPVTTLELFTLDAGFTQLQTTLPPDAGVVDFAATTLPDGRVLLTGGRATPGGAPLPTAYIATLDPMNGAVDLVATDSLAVPRAGHQATLLCDGTVLITGGTDPTMGPMPAERYNPPPDGRR